MRTLAATCACLVAAACHAPAPVPVTVATSRNPDAGLMHLALARGLPAAHGLQATVQHHAFGRLALEAVVQGRADVATVAVTPVVLAVLRGEPISVLATISTSSRNTVVVADRAAGIAGPADLAGKRVGLPHGTTADYFLGSLLERHGVPRASLREVELKPDQAVGALERREVDAVAVWYPAAAEVRRRLGARAVTFDAGEIYSESFHLVARADWVRGHGAAAQRLLAALLDAEALLHRPPGAPHPVQPSELCAGTEQVPPGHFDYRVQLEQGLLVLMEEEARWAIAAGVAHPGAPYDFLAAIDPAPLAAVRPTAVRLIR